MTDSGGYVMVELPYLQSYRSMGAASISCVQGCTCKESTRDCHSSDVINSQTHLHTFMVSQHAECLVKIEVRPRRGLARLARLVAPPLPGGEHARPMQHAPVASGCISHRQRCRLLCA